jgi:competence protein ComEA
MPSKPSRSQVIVYGALAVALLLIGARAIRAEVGGGSAQASAGGFSLAGSDASGPVPGGAGEGPGALELSAGGPDVVVDVAGAVRHPGVYRLPAGARVTDAVERAGGAGAGAELEAINLAARLSDGQQVLVPRGRAGSGPTSAAEPPDEGPISLGGATVEQLETIDGIGPVTAADIVRFRDEHGGLSSVDQLDQVSGIGPATMEALRARLQP